MDHSQDTPLGKHRDPSANIREQIELLLENQEALAEAREALLLERSAFRSRGKRVQAQRTRTGNSEVAFMDAVREFCNEQGFAFPPTLAAAYECVQEERDKLGPIEADYFQAEESLGGKEWEFMEQENDLYQYGLQELLSVKHLNALSHGHSAATEPHPSQRPPEPAVISTLTRYQDATSQHDQLLQQFDALRPEQARILDRKGSDYLDSPDLPDDASEELELFNQSSDLLSQIVDCEIKTRKLREESMHDTIPAETILFPGSAVTQPSRGAPPLMKTTAHFLLDGAVPNSFHGLPIRHRLPEWLLRYTKENALEKIHYLNVLRDELELFEDSEFNYPSWRELVTRLWLSDMSEQSSQPEEDLRSASHQSSRCRDAGIGSNTPGRHQGEVSHFVSGPNMKLALNFDANSNHAPLPALDYEPQPPLGKEPMGITFLIDPPPDILADQRRENLSNMSGRPLPWKEDTQSTETEIISGTLSTSRVEPGPSNLLTGQCSTSGQEHGLVQQRTITQIPEKCSISMTAVSNGVQRTSDLEPIGTSLLEFPASTRYGSCQESSVEEAQRLVPSLSEVMEGNSAPETGMLEHGSGSRVEPIPTMGPSIAPDLTAHHADISTERETTPSKDIGQSYMSLCTQPPSRTRSVTVTTSRLRQREPGPLQVPNPTQHKRSKSAPSAIYFATHIAITKNPYGSPMDVTPNGQQKFERILQAR